jgi:hypothetical protein
MTALDHRADRRVVEMFLACWIGQIERRISGLAEEAMAPLAVFGVRLHPAPYRRPVDGRDTAEMRLDRVDVAEPLAHRGGVERQRERAAVPDPSHERRGVVSREDSVLQVPRPLRKHVRLGTIAPALGPVTGGAVLNEESRAVGLAPGGGSIPEPDNQNPHHHHPHIPSRHTLSSTRHATERTWRCLPPSIGRLAPLRVRRFPGSGKYPCCFRKAET